MKKRSRPVIRYVGWVERQGVRRSRWTVYFIDDNANPIPHVLKKANSPEFAGYENDREGVLRRVLKQWGHIEPDGFQFNGVYVSLWFDSPVGNKVEPRETYRRRVAVDRLASRILAPVR